mgnify:CR=1 FL=1
MRTLQRETSQSGKDRYCGAPPVCTSGEVRQTEKAADGRATILAVGASVWEDKRVLGPAAQCEYTQTLSLIHI